MQKFARRRILGIGATLASGLAGCSALPDDGAPEGQSYDRLQRTAVYVDPNIDLALPADVPRVDATNNADLLILPGDTAYGPDQATDWLAADRVLALLGPTAERRWLDWARSEPFRNTFDSGGVSYAEPDPTLVVAAVGLDVTTYRRSWSDGPRDRDVLRALDESLVDLATRTKR